MLQMESEIPIADNTGARMAEMIGVIGKKNKRTAGVGDIITAHVRIATPTATVKKGEVVRAVVVRTAAPIRRTDGSVHGPVVAAHRKADALFHGKVSTHWHDDVFRRADGKNPDFRRIDDRRELRDPHHSQIGDRERRTPYRQR